LAGFSNGGFPTAVDRAVFAVARRVGRRRLQEPAVRANVVDVEFLGVAVDADKCRTRVDEDVPSVIAVVGDIGVAVTSAWREQRHPALGIEIDVLS
jgi:hypothetical protein